LVEQVSVMRPDSLLPGPSSLPVLPVLPVLEIPTLPEPTHLDLPKVACPELEDLARDLPGWLGSPSSAKSSLEFPASERQASSQQAAQVVKVVQSRWALDQKQSARMRWNRGRRLAVFSYMRLFYRLEFR
jgi:hypothetical protein